MSSNALVKAMVIALVGSVAVVIGGTYISVPTFILSLINVILL